MLGTKTKVPILNMTILGFGTLSVLMLESTADCYSMPLALALPLQAFHVPAPSKRESPHPTCTSFCYHVWHTYTKHLALQIIQRQTPQHDKQSKSKLPLAVWNLRTLCRLALLQGCLMKGRLSISTRQAMKKCQASGTGAVVLLSAEASQKRGWCSTPIFSE